MKNETEHNKRVITEIWHYLEKSRTENNSGAISQCQKLILDVAYEKYNLLDMTDRGVGIRVPVLETAPDFDDYNVDYIVDHKLPDNVVTFPHNSISYPPSDPEE